MRNKTLTPTKRARGQGTDFFSGNCVPRGLAAPNPPPPHELGSAR